MSALSRVFRRIRVTALSLVVVSGVLCAPSFVQACPTCKDALAQNDPQQQQMVKGYFYSIVFMMSMPFVVLGSFGGLAYFSIRRARRHHASSPERVAEGEPRELTSR